MKIILNKTYQNLGKKGEIKEVADGFARNFLLPRGIAFSATASNIAKITAEAREESKSRKENENELVKIKDEINGLSVKIKAQADGKGKLFGAVGKSEIQQALFDEIKVKIPKQKIDLKKSIKNLGQYAVEIQLSAKSKAKINLEIVQIKKKAKANK
ncbi:MAG: 50S ribosomal protein L9 [bacterium]|nr:50S ribosomal protein L9 [bacterium]